MKLVPFSLVEHRSGDHLDLSWTNTDKFSNFHTELTWLPVLLSCLHGFHLRVSLRLLLSILALALTMHVLAQYLFYGLDVAGTNFACPLAKGHI